MPKTSFVPVCLSLEDLLGTEYIDAVCVARTFCTGEDARALRNIVAEKVDFFPQTMQQRLLALHAQVGRQVTPPLATTASGAAPAAFTAATKTAMAPLTGYGYYRVGEDGRLYLISKSEHYHAPLGHAFPGYALLDHARRLGIPNATHNNTRGYITRRMEEELVHAANTDIDAPDALNRVLNLETGSLVTEAALKMMLARFYRIQADAPEPQYAGRVPVLLVMGNDDDGLHANYHGTTVLTQTMRGMWPELLAKMEAANLLQVRAIRPNRLDDAERLFATYEQPPYKIAGLSHEIVMMNYGARRLTPEFLTGLYRLCAAHDVPAMVDEIQSCLWHHALFMFREYHLRPAFVALGKGFPGGEYPASRLLFNSSFDTLPQFGALVTNGQEELASLAYLVTMRWAQANAEVTCAVGDYIETRFAELVDAFPALLSGCEGKRHLSALCFKDLEPATAFAKALNISGFDISAQTYKADCPPVVLTKLPIIAGYETVDLLVNAMRDVLATLSIGQPV